MQAQIATSTPQINVTPFIGTQKRPCRWHGKAKRSMWTCSSLSSNMWLASPQNAAPSRSRQRVALQAIMLPFAAITAVQPGVTAPAWPAVLTSCGVFIICCAAAALLLSAIPLLWSLARTANRMESMLQTLEAELPDTAATMRLSSLELSDCVNELGALGNDLSSGVRASAQLVSSAETGLRQGAQLIGSSLVPALAKRETQLRDTIEQALKVRAELDPQLNKARTAVTSTTTNVRRIRAALILSRAAGAAISMGRAFRTSLATTAAANQRMTAEEAAAVRRWRQQQQQQQRRGGGSQAQARPS